MSNNLKFHDDETASSAEPFDVFRTANFLVALYHEQAPAHAARNADEMLAAGDAARYDAWLEVGATIERLVLAEQKEDAAYRATHPALLHRLMDRLLGHGHGHGHAGRLRHNL